MATGKARFLYAEEPGLEQMWLGVQAEFQKATGDKNFDIETAKQLSIREVLEKANPPPPKDGDKHSARVAKAHNVLRRTLYVVNAFGQMAGQAASMVFGPSCLCVNAVSYLCDSVKNTLKIYEGMADLFERIAEFLEKFNVHVQDEASGLQVDNALRKVLHELLLLFSSICIKAIKIAKRPKVLQFGRVFSFGADEGIQADLDKFEALVARQTGLTAALILSAVSKEARDISAGFAEQREAIGQIDQKQNQVLDVTRRLADGEKRNEQNQAEKEDRETIKKVLQINDELAKEPWKLKQTECRSGEVKESGSWLHSLPDFLNWKRKDTTASCIYSLKGSQSFGKTFLCSSVVDHLRNHYAKEEQDRKILVASYYFRDIKNSTSSQASESVHEAIRALIWQLSLNDKVFEKSVSSICKSDQTKGESSSVEIWRDLVLERPKKMDMTIFIVLDSVDNALGENNPLAEILSETEEALGAPDRQLNIRFFLTGDKALETLQEKSKVYFPVQPLGSVNRTDLSKYIERSMDQITTLKLPLPGQDRNPKIEDLREDIRERLIAGANGDYLKIEYKLQEIATKRYPTEIEEVLKRANEDREETIVRQLNSISESLRRDEIEELNLIIQWCIIGREVVSVALLEEALSVGQEEQSLIPLATQIRDRYSSLLYMDDNTTKENMLVSLHSSALADYLVDHDANEDSSIAATNQTIQAAEVAIVRRFLGLVCDDELWRKFEFEDFFAKKLAKGPARVQFSDSKGTFDVLKSCLLSICNAEEKKSDEQDDDGKKTSELLVYSRVNLFLHVLDFKLERHKDAEKKAIAPLIWNLLTDPKGISSWTAYDSLGTFQEDWLATEEATDVIIKWFKDPVFREGLGDVSTEQAAWIKAFTSDDPGEIDLLVHAAESLAAEWVFPEGYKYPYHFKNVWCCLQEYLGKVKYRNNPEERKKHKDRSDLEQLVLDVVDFVKDSLKITAPDVNWNYTIAKTLFDIERYEPALVKCQEILKVQPDHWTAQLLFGQCLSRQQKWQASIDQLKDLMEMHKNNPDFIEVTSKQLLGTLEARQASMYYCLEKYDEAVFWYRESQAKKLLNNEVLMDLLRALTGKGGRDEVLKYVEEMHAIKDDKYATRLLALSVHAADWPEFINTIAFAMRRCGKFDLFNTNFLATLDILSKDPTKTDDFFMLSSSYGQILFYFDDTRPTGIPYLEKNLAELESKRFWSRGLRDWSIRNTILGLAEWHSTSALEEKDEALAAEHNARFIQITESPQYSHRFLRLMRVRYHHLRGEKELMRKSARSYAQDLLDMLSDDDIENDGTSYYHLSKLLLAIDDEVNAMAGFYISGGLEAQEAAEKDEAEIEAKAKDTGEAKEEASENTEAKLPNVHSNGLQPGEERADVPTAPDANPTKVSEQAADDKSNAEQAQESPSDIVHEQDRALQSSEGSTGSNGEEAANDLEKTSSGEKASDAGSTEEESSKPAECERPRVGLSWGCTGMYCKVEGEFIEEVWICKFCGDIIFCPGCYEKLMSDNLDQASCGKKHPHLYVPKMDREWWHKEPRNMMKIGDELMKISDWVDGIKKTFEIV